MKKWTGRWLECRIRSFWSVHSKGPSWQLTQRPLQKNRSLTLMTVWGENVSGPEHCQNPPGAVCSYWSGMRERNREQKRGRKKEGLREKRDIGAWFLSSVGQERDGCRWQGIYLLPKCPLKRGAAAQNTQTKSHDDRHNTFFFPSEWFSLSNSATGIFKSCTILESDCLRAVRVNLIRKNTAERFSLPRNYFILIILKFVTFVHHLWLL